MVRALHNQRSLKVFCLELSILFNTQPGWFCDAVKAKTIFVVVEFRQQATHQLCILVFINLALKHRFLNALPGAFTYFCNTPKPFSPGVSVETS